MAPARLCERLEEIDLFPERADRVQALVAIAEEFVNPGPDEVPRTPERRIPGCESEAYLNSWPEGAGRRFRFAVDNPQGISAMALARILEEGLSGAPPAEVAEVSDEIVFRIFGTELSMGKSLGLTGMVRMAKAQSVGSG